MRMLSKWTSTQNNYDKVNHDNNELHKRNSQFSSIKNRFQRGIEMVTNARIRNQTCQSILTKNTKDKITDRKMF